MDTTLTVANAWQRMRRQSVLRSRTVAVGVRDAAVDEPAQDVAHEADETLPMLYRSEAFAEDLSDSHPLLT